MTNKLRHGSLFSGIGGFDLASEWMGWENVFHCEWNEFGKKVLKHYWPNAESFDDITKTDFTKYANKIDILTGGFPCQPYSSAGKRLGKEDERHLWPEMLRAIHEIKPKYIVGENVFGLLNWNGGMVFNEVHLDLEAAGYEVQAVVIPAAAVNAPHGRDRVWFVAYSKDNDAVGTRKFRNKEWQSNSQIGARLRYKLNNNGINGDATNTNGNGFNECNINNEINPSQGGQYAHCDIEQSNGNGDVTDTNPPRLHKQYISTKSKKSGSCCRLFDERGDFSLFPTQSPICGGNDGLPTELDGITFSKWRNESIKAYGNAIVPQVAYQIFKAINDTIHDKPITNNSQSPIGD